MNRKFMKESGIAGLLVCASAALCGCADDIHVVQNPQDRAVEFSTYLGRNAQTKADGDHGFDGLGSSYQFGGTPMDDAELKKTAFGVSAVYTGQDKWEDWHTSASEVSPNFMFKQKVYFSEDEGAWKYEPVKYWPTRTGDKVSFFAYAPFATENNTYGFARSDVWTAQHYSLKFTIQDKADEMVDFVAATVMDRTYKTEGADGSDSYGTPVVFKFEHALTRLLFSAKTSKDLASESHVVITGARLVKGSCYYKQGNFSFTKKRNTQDNNDSFWGKTNDRNGDLIQSDYDLTPILAASAGPIIGGKEYPVSAMDLKSATPVSMFKKKVSGESASQCYLFLIPTSGSTDAPGIPANTAAVAFDYDIVTKDSSLAAGYSCTSATKIVYLPEGIMQKGKAYNVTFTFNVDKIDVSASVESWDDAAGSEVDVPFTPDDASTGA